MLCMLLLLSSMIGAKAQFYDNSAYNYGMYMIYQSQLELIEFQKKLSQHEHDNLLAIIQFLPGNSSKNFGALITLSTSKSSWIKVKCVSADGKAKTLRSGKDYFVTGQYLFIFDGLSNGTKLEVLRANDEKVLASDFIPMADSSSFASFVSQTQQNAAFVANLTNNQWNNLPSSNNSISLKKKGRICKACYGRGICGTCKGFGWIINPYGGGKLACPNCSAANGRICDVCNGTGEW